MRSWLRVGRESARVTAEANRSCPFPTCSKWPSTSGTARPWPSASPATVWKPSSTATCSCGTAAYLGHAVYVTDIATNPLWADFRELAADHGLRACWSTPIERGPHQIIGTFAIYHHTPRGPTSRS
ncbi:MAG: GAF domain-containing protein [Caulobacter sp.]|nr:GAF domain-containing protein [Caulobacter sp.]